MKNKGIEPRLEGYTDDDRFGWGHRQLREVPEEGRGSAG